MENQSVIKSVIKAVNSLSEGVILEHPVTAETLTDKTKELLQSPSSENLSPWTIRDLHKRGVLHPDDLGVGRKPRYDFTLSDLKRVLAIHFLKVESKLSSEEAAKIAISAFPTANEPAKVNVGAPSFSQNLYITGTVERANRYIWTRSLLHVVSIFFDTLPINTIVVVDRKQGETTEWISEQSEPKVIWGSYFREPDRVVAKVNQELLPFFHNECRAESVTHFPKPTIFQVGDPHTKTSYKLIIAWPHEGKRQLTSSGAQILREKPERQLKLIITLLGVLFQQYIPTQTNVTTLDAVAYAITEIVPQIDSCCIYLPDKDTNNIPILKLQARGGSDQNDIPEYFFPSSTLVGWVHEIGIPIFIEDLECEDWRAADLEHIDWSSVAAIPTAESFNQEVVLVGGKKSSSEQQFFDQLSRDLLIVMASIVGVIILGERSEETHLPKRIQKLIKDPLPIIDFGSALKQPEELFFKTTLSERSTSPAAIAVVAISIANSDQIQDELGTVYLNWLRQLVLEILNSQYLEPRMQINDTPATISEIETGRFVLIFPKIVALEDQLKRFSAHLKKLLNSLVFKRENVSVEISAYSWVLYFPYPYLSLSRKIRSWNTGSIISLIEARTIGALQNLPRIERGNFKLRVGDYEGAHEEFEAAILDDPENPYLYKHDAETLFNMLKFKDTIDRLQTSLRLDDQYASAHCLMGEANAAIGEFDKAINEYQLAISIKPKPDFMWLLGEELMLHGDYISAEAQFRRAKQLDPDRARAYDIMVGVLHLENGRFEDAYNLLAPLQEDEQLGVIAQFHLKQARHKMKKHQSELEKESL